MGIRRAVGMSSYLDATRIHPISRPEQVRLVKRDEPDIETEQEKHLQEFIEARKRQSRLTMVPKTETREEIEMARINSLMTGIGLGAGAVVIITGLALLIHYQGWWVLGFAIGVPGLAFCGRKLEWW